MRRPRHPLWRGLAACVGLAALGAVTLVLGFLAFAGTIAADPPPLTRHADGMVVLTGDAERIPAAVRLLAAGHADRLLISGVNTTIAEPEVADLTPLYRDLFACCIDLGYAARDTVGNGQETRSWAQQHGLHSLIVVTSAYHMPRALAEISARLPAVELLPYPVKSAFQRERPWWRDRSVARLLGREYLKFLAAKARTTFVALKTPRPVLQPDVAMQSPGPMVR